MPSAAVQQKRRVVVTGIGMVTPLGQNSSETWQGLLDGAQAAKEISQFDASGWPVSIACEVNDFQLNPNACRDETLVNRPNAFGMQAAFEAMQDAGLEQGGYQPERLGIAMGAGIGAIKPDEVLNLLPAFPFATTLAEIARQTQERWPDPTLLERNHPATLSSLLAKRWQAAAFQNTVTTACAASAQAIGYGFKRVQRGQCDYVLAGGADSLAGVLLHAGFCMLGVLSRKDAAVASRPFDQDRDGFVASEGAAVLLLEDFAHAKARGSKIYAEILGYGESENAYRITDLPEHGEGAVLAMKKALASASLHPGEVAMINAHGTSTEQNDRVEALAIEKVFYDCGASPVVTANKSALGHCVAASGAVEAASTCLSVYDQLVPPIVNFNQSDCSAKIDFVRQKTRPMLIEAAISNSFGFGGTNACLAFGRALE